MKSRIVLAFGLALSFFAGIFPEGLAQTGIIREVYNNIGAGTISALTNSPRFPNAPAIIGILDQFEAPQNFANNYGQRLRGYLVAPQTGNYIFWLEADLVATLYLSPDENPADKTQIAIVTSPTAPREWDNPSNPNQKSPPISLQAGKKYYIEVLMADSFDNDHLAVRWQLPDGTIEEPIPGSRIFPEIIPPQIVTQPATVRVTEGSTASFTVTAANLSPVSYQWQRNTVSIPGATNATFSFTASMADNNSRYRVIATNSFGIDTSTEAVLLVDPDVVTPNVLSVQNPGANDLVAVTFSKPMDPASASSIANYFVNGGISVQSATLSLDGRTVILKTSPLTFGQTYTLTMNDILDRAATPNAIDPDSSGTFAFNYSPLDPSFVKGARETLGPSSRRTGLVISEIMYHPAPRTDGKNLEFIELFNSLDTVENIGGFHLSGAIDYTFPAGSFIPGRSFLVVGPSPLDLQTIYGIPRAYGGFSGTLATNIGTLQLEDNLGALLLEASYGSVPPWPASPDGTGHSLVLARPSYGEGDPKAWAASEAVGGSPGQPEPVVSNPYRSIVINEFLAHPEAARLQYIELYNYSTQAVNISGCSLSDDPSANKFQIPANTIVPSLGFISFDQTQLGFLLNGAGSTIYLKNPQRTRVIDAVRFEAQATGLPSGRYPDGAPSFRILQAQSPGTPNAAPARADVVINEIMYHPASGNSDDEYVELYNRGSNAVDISGWAFTSGINFTFPAKTSIASHGYLVVARNVKRLLSNYSNLNNANTVGNFQGALAHGGERLALSRPDTLSTTNSSGNTSIIPIYVLVNEVNYRNGGRWGQWSDGGGSSLELIDPQADNNLAPNWADSDETAKSQWTTIERTGVLDNGNTNFQAVALHILLEGEGEALLDNVEVHISTNSTNLVVNSTFETGTNGWIWQGTHEDTSLDTPGFASATSLHIRSAGRGDTASNRIRGLLRAAVPNGATATIRAQARWLKGNSEMLIRFWGNYLEAAGSLSVPKNLGTPGLPNSRLVTNAGPSIVSVSHFPILPAAHQNVTVTAQISDNDRIGYVTLAYRVEPSTNLIRVGMTYSGAGYYSATIPGQALTNLAAFHLIATDTAGASSTFPSDAPARECLVMFGASQPAGTYGNYNLWMTRSNITRWTNRDKSSNKLLDATFAYHGERVSYNMGTMYSGSPYHWTGYNGPLNNICNYIMNFPGDDLFLGQTDFVLNAPGNANGTGGTDTTALEEQTFYWIVKEVGNKYTHRRDARVFLNGNLRGAVYEDAQQPNGDFIKEWYPNDSNGELFKIEDWFEFPESLNTIYNTDATLENFTTVGGQKKKERYRWNFRERAVKGTFNNYTNLFALVDAVNDPNPATYVEHVESLVNMDEWLGQIALRHAAGDWDSYGYKRGKNMYAYKPQNGKWELLHWDIAFAFGAGDPPNMDLYYDAHFDGRIDPVTETMFRTPAFKRIYVRKLLQIANGPMIASRIEPVIDAKHDSLVANGIGVQSTESVKSWISQRRDFILSQLSSFNASFAVTSNNGKNFSTNKNQIILSGTAPVEVDTIKINGVEYPITWTSETAWTMRYALSGATNDLVVQGFDDQGNAIGNSLANLRVTYTGATEKSADRIVINEIMFNPAAPDAEFVELHNTSRNYAFDLTGYRIDGIGFKFTDGAIIPPSGFALIVKNVQGFTTAYGPGLPIAGSYSGTLSAGDSLTLLAPSGTNEVIVDAVRFDNVAPWPLGADGTGGSLQLIDPLRDSSRVGNWAVSGTNSTPGATNSLVGSLAAFPPVWVNEVQANNATGITDSTGAHGAWVELYNSSTNPVSLEGLYLTDNYTALTRWAFPAKTQIAGQQYMIVWLDGKTNSTGELHANFKIDPGTGTIALVGLQNGVPKVFDYLSYANLTADTSFGADPDGQAVNRHLFGLASPGASNNTSGPPVSVFINEWMAGNTHTLLDPADGKFEDWFELYNASSTPANLGGFYLTDKASALTMFSIPKNTIIPPGGFLLVWADNVAVQTGAGGDLHANFKLGVSGASIGLVSPGGTIVDWVTFGPQAQDVSQGRLPDGASGAFQSFPTPTPRASNVIVDPNAIRIRANINAGNVTITWNSKSGVNYQVQYKNALSDSTWLNLQSVTATGSASSAADVVGTNKTRFYRIIQL